MQSSMPMNALPFHGVDVSEFFLEMFELKNGLINFSHERLISLNYNPLISGAGHLPFFSNDLDPDSHFYDNFDNHCDYFVEDQFKKMLNSQISCAPSFSLFHLNIRSLERNLSNLTNLLSTLNIEFSVIGITETWLKNSEHSVDIEGWNLIIDLPLFSYFNYVILTVTVLTMHLTLKFTNY
jgi:hypothetical protein